MIVECEGIWYLYLHIFKDLRLNIDFFPPDFIENKIDNFESSMEKLGFLLNTSRSIEAKLIEVNGIHEEIKGNLLKFSSSVITEITKIMKKYYFAGTQNDLEHKIDNIGCSIGTNVTFQPERTSKLFCLH